MGAVLLTAALIPLLIASAEGAELRRRERTVVPCEGRARLVIESGSGDIRVRGAGEQIVVNADVVSRHEHSAEAQRRLDAVRIEIKRLPDRVEVRALQQPSSGTKLRGLLAALRPQGCGVRVAYDISIPPRMSLDAELTSGEVDVAMVDGPLSIRATSGRVKVLEAGAVSIDLTSGEACIEQFRGSLIFYGTSGDLFVALGEGDLRADVTSGRVQARDVRGDLRITGGSCDVGLDRVAGDVVFEATSGDLRIAQGCGNVEMKSSSGGLAFSGRVPPGGWLRAVTVSGDLWLQLGEDASADIVLETETGSIRPGVYASSLRPRAEHRLVGRVGEGDPAEIRLQTASGDITLSRR